MNEPVRIDVGTNLLRQILEANPEVTLQLRSMAAEKIAEEIVRKIRNTYIGDIELDLRRKLSQEADDACNAFRQRHRFPDEAKVEIKRLATEQVDFLVAKAVRDAQAEIGRKVELAVKTAVADSAADWRATIKQLAREEFLAVLREVKGGI